MSTFKITCPECQCTLEADEAWEGMQLPCPKCSKKLSVKNPEKVESLPAVEEKKAVKETVPEKVESLPAVEEKKVVEETVPEKAAVVLPSDTANQVEAPPVVSHNKNTSKFEVILKKIGMTFNKQVICTLLGIGCGITGAFFSGELEYGFWLMLPGAIAGAVCGRICGWILFTKDIFKK